MKAKYKAKLEAAIDKFIEDNCQDDDMIPSEAYYPDCLVEMMTDAAEVVFDMSVQAQQFAKEQ